MKILMIGLGSIGQRHLRNIKRIFGDAHQILAYRVRRLQQTFADDMSIREGVSLEEEYGITVYFDLDEALNVKPDIAFITNITAKHMECALKAARAGCHLFIEKPISHSMDGIRELSNILDMTGKVAYIGYQNRKHICFKRVKELLEMEEIGKLIYVDCEYSERLTTMHSYEDYSTTYMAKSAMGGGPVLNLQVHDLDCLQWLFGTPISVFSVMEKRSNLKIDVEDSAFSIYRFQYYDRTIIPVYTHTDFLQYPPVHRFKIVGEKGRIELDLNVPQLDLILDGKVRKREEYLDFKRNDMFIEELKEFFECIQKGEKAKIDIKQGSISLKMALAAKQSSVERREIILEELL